MLSKQLLSRLSFLQGTPFTLHANDKVDNDKPHYDFSDLRLAIQRGDVYTVKKALKNVLVNTQDEKTGKTALHLATESYNGNSKYAFPFKRIILILKKHNANPNIQDKEGNTPLHYATRNPDPAITHLLLDHFKKTHRKIKNNKGRYAYHFHKDATQKGAPFYTFYKRDKAHEKDSLSHHRDQPKSCHRKSQSTALAFTG